VEELAAALALPAAAVEALAAGVAVPDPPLVVPAAAAEAMPVDLMEPPQETMRVLTTRSKTTAAPAAAVQESVPLPHSQQVMEVPTPLCPPQTVEQEARGAPLKVEEVEEEEVLWGVAKLDLVPPV
jgi:hypothetical protein